jgi:hypothetical protein
MSEEPALAGDGPAMVTDARRICEEAERRGIKARLLGGIAIWLRSEPVIRAQLGREYADIDLVTVRKHSKPLRELLESLGYVPDKMFNATQGDRRLYFHSSDGAYHLDIFIDRFVMSHDLDLSARLQAEPLVLPAAELLVTKLQIAELNRKDAADTAMLLLGHEPGERDGPGQLNISYVADVCGQDWGLYTTLTDNLEKTQALLGEILADPDQRQLVTERSARILAELQDAPKSRGWRRRAKIGRRMRWYETPDEATR